MLKAFHTAAAAAAASMRKGEGCSKETIQEPRGGGWKGDPSCSGCVVEVHTLVYIYICGCVYLGLIWSSPL